MAKVSQAAKVGLFVLLSGSATYVVWRTVSKEVGINGNYTVHAHIKDATGLALHSRVTIAGIAVGSIDSIKLENGAARIDVKMDKNVPLYQNATLGKKSASLLGESTIVLTAGTEDQPKLKDGDEIHAITESASMEEITKSGRQDRPARRARRRSAGQLARHREGRARHARHPRQPRAGHRRHQPDGPREPLGDPRRPRARRPHHRER